MLVSHNYFYCLISDYTTDKSTQGSLNWLEHNRGDRGNWEEVLRQWNKTSLPRLHSLINEAQISEAEIQDKDGDVENEVGEKGTKGKKGRKKKATKISKQVEIRIRQMTAHDYMVKYPAFLEDTGYMLVSMLSH